MAVKESQIRYNAGEGHPDCTHPNIEYSELSKGAEDRRRYKHGIETKRAEVDALKKWHAGKHFEMLGDAAAAVDCFNQSQGSKANADGKGFEQKVADSTNAKWTSIQFHCPQCGLSGDIDVVTDKGVAKECKISADAASEGQFNKICSAASAIFGAGAVVHMALPPGQAAAVRRKFTQDMKGKVQSH
jgi:hypothetical protein